MQAWYDIKSLDRMSRNEDEEGMRDSLAALRSVLADEETLVDSQRIVIGGFSMGSAMSALLALTHSNKLAGCVCCSGYVVLRDALADERSDANRSLPVLAVHGESDPMVPLWFAEESYKFLREELSVALAFETVPGMQHEMPLPVCQRVLNQLQQWLPDNDEDSQRTAPNL